MSSAPFVDSILHATDFSETSERAFAHALAVALLRRAKLTLLHAGGDPSGGSWREFPGIRETLERWGLLQPGSARADVFGKLSVRAEKVFDGRGSAVAVIDAFVAKDKPDLLVLGTAGRKGLPRWLRPSTAERAAQRSRTMTLFVPESAPGFVALEDGATSLRKILVPVAEHPDPGEALIRASRVAETLGDWPVSIDVLHVGADEPPDLELPEGEAWKWRRVQRSGDPVEEILAAAHEIEADLLVMATAGREGVLDALRGSTTQQVLRDAPCPLLAVPAIGS